MSTPLTLGELCGIARQVADSFAARNQKHWSIEVSTLELAKQVGDLSRAILMREGYYLADRANRPEYDSSNDAIGDELADVLFRLMIIADFYGIDLEEAHLTARRRELKYLGVTPTF